MPYVPINTAAYTATFAGAIAGMAVSGWITDPDSADYNDVIVIAGAFAQAFDTIWNDVAQLNELELACMTSVVQQDFSGRGPGPFESTLFKDPANWNIAARACAALILECDIVFAVEGIVPGPGGSPTPASIAAAYETNWLVTDWYIDGVVGVDTNDGTSVGTPIKTGEELLKRLGPYAIWPQSVTVHVLANGMIDALVLRGLMAVAGTHLDVDVTPVVLATDTIATYTARNHLTPVASQLTGANISDFSPYQWRRLRLTSGANIGAVAWIACANPAGAGLGTARTTQWCNLVFNSATLIRNNSITPVPGDSFVIEQLVEIPAMSIHLNSVRSVAAGFAWDKRFLAIRGVSTRMLEVSGGAAFMLSVAPIFGCRLSNVYLFDNNQNSLGIGTLTGCSFFWDDPVSTVYRVPKAAVENCLFGDGVPAVTNSENSLLVSQCLYQGVNAQSGDVNSIQVIDLQVFDVPGATSVAFTWKNGRVSNLSGSGNAGFGVGIPNRSSLSLLGTINLVGAVSPARLTTAPAINLTFPQFLQPDDYAQKGITPPMVAGTTTVTVPWYDNITQQVQATHATFGGTPGTLSVQQTSNTQFVITSSSASDTSTVRWQISPLGRNIFISTS